MYNVTISPTMKKKIYFWYLYRCFKILEKKGVIKLTEVPNPYFEEPHYEYVTINDYPIFFDFRDDITITKNLSDYANDYILFKSNFSTEFWDMAQKGEYPEGFEYKLEDWELAMQPNIRAFALGRALNIDHFSSEFKIFPNTNVKSKYKIVSLNGAGILKRQTMTRLHLYDMMNDIYKDQVKLMFFNRSHFREQNEVKGYNYYLKKYPRDINTGGYKEYLDFLRLGTYSINVPGIGLSTPFRFVDSIIAGRNIITTKVWHDVYSLFPAVELPICGYLGIGDWDKVEAVLNNLDSVNSAEMVNKARCCYSWYLSYQGMWKNQILNNLEGKI